MASCRGVSLSEIGRHSAAPHCARALRRQALRQQGRVGTRGRALRVALELCERPWRGQERPLARRWGASRVSDQQRAAWRHRTGR
jgi:hypothetical protein